MMRLGLLLRKNWAISALFLVLAVVYIVQVLNSTFTPAMQAKYHATSSQLHQLALAVGVPYIVIWVVGLVGYLWMRSYSSLLGKDKDAAGFKLITRSIFLYTFWLPASTLAANLASSYYTSHPSSTALLVRIVTYLNIFILLPAFWWVYQGANKLLAASKINRTGLSPQQTMTYIAFAAVYVFVTFHDPARANSPDGVEKATYYLNDWWILLTIVIPRLIMWYVGFAAAASIILYRHKVKGTIYKEALRWVAFGLVGIVSSTIVLRVVQSLSTQIAKLSLLTVFLVVYVLLALIATGYVLLAKGASRLQKIEEL